MSAKLIATLGALGVAALAGCELVAGIRDIALTDGGDSPGDATTASEDSGASDDAGGHDTAAPPDARDTGTTGDVTSSPDVGGDAKSTADAGDGGSAEDARDASAGDSDSGPVSYAVPLVEPDGGALQGDAGPLFGELIDDIDSEFTPGWILPRSGRAGTWFTYDDGTDGGVVPTQPQSSATPSLIVGTIAGPDGQASNLAAHVTGSGTAAYAGLGFNLAGGAPSFYDATAYRGFTFWARVGGDSGSVSLRFAVPDRNTSAGSGICPDAGTGCGDYFAKTITFTPNWQHFVIFYDQLGQTGFGLPKGLTGLDAAHIYSCQFQLAAGAVFDVWIDDVYFIDR